MSQTSMQRRAAELTAPLTALGDKDLEKGFAPVVEATLEALRLAAVATGADEDFTVTSVSAVNEGELDGEGGLAPVARRRRRGAKMRVCIYMFGYQYCFELDCPVKAST